MRAIAKYFAERALVLLGLAAAGRVRLRRDILVLAYHNVLPEGERAVGDTSLHLPRRDFSRQLDALERTHDVVPLATMLDERVESLRPRVVITFDDAYVGALTVGVSELVRRGMPATIFVAPGMLGIDTWWDVLADPVRGALSPALRSRCLTEFAGDRDAILRALTPNAVRSAGGHSSRIGTEAELATAARQPGMGLGSHSWSHGNLCALAPAALERELTISMHWLRARFPNFTPWLSYPYGLHTSAIEQAAASRGYVGALRIDGGWSGMRAAERRHAIPRYNVPSGLSIDGFRLRLGGWGAG